MTSRTWRVVAMLLLTSLPVGIGCGPSKVAE
jgi:hypothetical protein